MKAYQVHTGDENKHGHQVYNLVSTYLNKEKALEHCQQIVGEYKRLSEEEVSEHEEENGKWILWVAAGWGYVVVCKMDEIEIIP
jgi:hypothetical protein